MIEMKQYYNLKIADLFMIALLPLVIFGNSFGITVFYTNHYIGIAFFYGAYFMLGLFTALQRYNATKLGLENELERVNNRRLFK